MTTDALTGKTVLITGGAHRVGAVVSRFLHAQGANLAIHYRSSSTGARALESALNEARPGSVLCLQADLLETSKLPGLVEQTVSRFGRLDALINNASTFYPTPMGEASEGQWNDLIGTNLKAPFFLAQAAAAPLRASAGCIVNIVDIYAERPLKNHPIYSAAKAGLLMLTQSLARELGPAVRVNAIAPGTILWPERGLDVSVKAQILERTPLKRAGSPDDIARTILFLIADAPYISGQVLAVDGGRSIVL